MTLAELTELHCNGAVIVAGNLRELAALIEPNLTEANEPILRFAHRVAEDMLQAKEALSAGQTSRLAWLARNLVELKFISEWTFSASANLQRLRNDATLDEIELLDKSMAAAANIDPQFQPDPAVVTRLQHLHSVRRGTRHKALATHEIADELGKKAEFSLTFKFLSKFSHPTAWSLLVAERSELLALYLIAQAHFFGMVCNETLWRAYHRSS